MSVEPLRRPIDEQTKIIQLPPTIPAVLYEGPDPHQYADVVEQNEKSIVEEKDPVTRDIEQLTSEEITQPGLLDDETRKRLMMQRARDICLNPDISNSVAWEHMKILLKNHCPDLPVDRDFEVLDMSPDARKVALTVFF